MSTPAFTELKGSRKRVLNGGFTVCVTPEETPGNENQLDQQKVRLEPEHFIEGSLMLTSGGEN